VREDVFLQMSAEAFAAVAEHMAEWCAETVVRPRVSLLPREPEPVPEDEPGPGTP
jgi:hypothetical protein